MPELPEVETTRRGVEPLVRNQKVEKLVVRETRLRWPVPCSLVKELPGQVIEGVQRRAKYLLFETSAGTMILHLGMSGSLRVLEQSIQPGPHDHLDVLFESGQVLRYRDPRRFGFVLWTRKDPLQHVRLSGLGPEPLDGSLFNANYLFQRSRGRRQAVKTFLMDNRTVVGVGNIYASESLYRAGIRPAIAAGRISRARYQKLVLALVQVLDQAIAAGGTTLRDFVDQQGRPGYFQQHLEVYGRAGEPCHGCGSAIVQIRQGQRSSFYCRTCQR